MKRTAKAVWNGTLKDGSGNMEIGKGACEGSYSFASRFEDGQGTNPEELIAAAHAGCFSMALAGALGQSGYEPRRVTTTATVELAPEGEGFKIPAIELDTEAEVGGADEDAFRKCAEDAKNNCPVSKALAGVDIRLNARLA